MILAFGFHPSAERTRIVRLALVTIGIWTLLGFFQGYQYYLNAAAWGKARPLGEMIIVPLIRYWIFAALTPFVFYVSRRWPLATGGWVKSGVAHLAALLIFMALHNAIRLLVFPVYEPSTGAYLPVTWTVVVGLFRTSMFEQLWMYGSIAGVAHAVQYYRRFRERESREAQLKAQVAEYELQILKMQLHPHFLFNTLHAISTLMNKDVPAARRMIIRLSDLLRVALAHVSKREIPLKSELEFVESYLEIEQMRLGDRMTVEWQVDPATLHAGVPNMILQPLVENAVRHGIAARRSGGVLRIRSGRSSDRLLIAVSNEGPPLPPDSPGRRNGLGLGNTRARLQQLYPGEYRLDIHNQPEGGVEVVLEFPFHDLSGSNEDESYAHTHAYR